MGRPPRFCIGLALCFAACGVAAAQPVIDATITGRLLQKRGDTVIPLLDCTVFARSIDTGPLAGEYPDSQGRFRLDFPPHSRVTVGTICPGYQIFEINGRRTLPPTHDCSAPGPCADVQLTLQPLAVIEGYVVDHNGMPLEQISIQLRPPGADGQCYSPPLPPGRYWVIALPMATRGGPDLQDPEARKKLAPWGREVTLAPGQNPKLDLTLAPEKAFAAL